MARRTTASAEPPAEQPGEQPTDGTSAQSAPTVTVEPEPTPEPQANPQPAPASEAAFFTWLRRLEVPRRSGWLGGVCAGIADRLGIDPLLVRGIVVVLAVVGAPATLLYAIAWFLLPDEDGTIHAQQLGHGRVTPALPGIVVLFLLSFLPLTQGFWYAGALYWGDTGWAGSIARIAWTGVLLIAIIVLVVWLARRATTDVPTTPATTDDRPDTVPSFPADAGGADADAGAVEAGAAVVAVAAASADGSVTAPGEPPAPPADASAEELAAWKQSQDAWQQQRAAWAAEQKRSEREKRQAEAHERSVAAAAAARERARIRKLTRPRASAGVVFLILGVGLVAGALAAFAASGEPATAGAEWVIGAAVLTLVLGLGTVVVGLARRRSGALAFFSILSVLALAVAVIVPTDRALLPPGVSFGISGTEDGRYAQFAGATTIYVSDRDGKTATVDLWQLAGSVQVELEEGATLRVELTSDGDQWVSVQEQNYEGDGRSAVYRMTDGHLQFTAGDGDPDVVLRAWLGRSAYLLVQTWIESDPSLTLDPAPDEWQQWNVDDGSTTDLLAPTPTPTPDPAATDAGGN